MDASTSVVRIGFWSALSMAPFVLVVVSVQICGRLQDRFTVWNLTLGLLRV